MSAPAQRSFADGEIAPALYARVDHIKYARGLRRCRNMIVLREGGATNRAGTVFLNEVKDSSDVGRLIEFVLDSTDIGDTYILEFGDGYIRFYQDGARITTSGVAAWADATAYLAGDLVSEGGVTYYCIADHTSTAATDTPGTGTAWQTYWYAQTSTIYEIPSPYLADDLEDLVFWQDGETIFLTHQSYAPRELTRTSSTRWVLTAMAIGPSIAAPTNVNVTGGSAGVITYWAVTAVKEGTREESLAGLFSAINLVPSSGSPATVTWTTVEDAESYNVYRSADGETYGLINSAGGTAVATEDASWGDTNEQAQSNVPNAWLVAAGQLRNALTISGTTKAYDGKYRVTFQRTLSVGAGGAGARGRIGWYYSRDAETRVFAGYSGEITLIGEGTMGPTLEEHTIDVPDNGYTALTIDGVPEVFPFTAHTCTMIGDTSMAAHLVAWDAGATEFTDAGDDPDFSLGPPSQQDLFSSPGNFPATGVDFQQRRFFGGTSNAKQSVNGSVIASRRSFVTSTPLQSSDTIAFTLVGKRAQAVKHMMDLDGLLVFTAANVHQVLGDEAGILRPDALNPKRVARHGIGRLAPLEVDSSALYVAARGTTVRDLFPVETGGALGSYRGTNVSLFASHLFKGYTIVDWAYAEEPFGVVWCVRSDGVLLGLTYLREFGIWGWHRHDTDGVVENIAVVPEGDEDAVYLIVKRTIDGSTARYVERMATRYFADADGFVDAIFMDCALTIDGRHTGATTMTLSGGTDWDNEEQLTLTASAATFSAGDVGNAFHLIGADGSLVRCAVEAYTDTTHVTVRPDRTVPDDMQAVAIGNGSGSWGRAINTATGLSHLEGETVSIVGDGFVVASPNNPEYDERTVSGGEVALGANYVTIHVGLPYTSDIETLDIGDSPGRTTKDVKKAVSKVGVYLENSRGVWAGRPDLWSADDLLEGLEEMKPRQDEDYDDPPELVTDWKEIDIGTDWNSNGRVIVRQVDPLPMTVLSVSPIGYGV